MNACGSAKPPGSSREPGEEKVVGVASTADPHFDAPVATAGPDVGEARALVVVLHGRGGSAQSILDLSRAVRVPGVTWWAPQASRFSWYPNGFMAPVESNQPHLDSALRNLGSLVERAGESGLSASRIVLAGFSQGACLSLEWAARNPGAVGAVVGLSGGLIGPEGREFDYSGGFDRTPIFMGCSDRDPHIPLKRVEESAEVLARMGAAVEKRIYEGMGHTVVEDELGWFRGTLEEIAGGP